MLELQSWIFLQVNLIEHLPFLLCYLEEQITVSFGQFQSSDILPPQRMTFRQTWSDSKKLALGDPAILLEAFERMQTLTAFDRSAQEVTS